MKIFSESINTKDFSIDFEHDTCLNLDHTVTVHVIDYITDVQFGSCIPLKDLVKISKNIIQFSEKYVEWIKENK